MRLRSKRVRLFPTVLGFLLLAVLTSCQDSSSQKPRAPLGKQLITKVNDAEHFQQIMSNSNGKLLVVEFYADWCPPCRELAPILEEIAKENKGNVDIYKINTDENRNLAYTFRVTGIPHVVFIKNRERLMSLSGLYAKEMYLKAIRRFSQVQTDKKPGVGERAA